MRDATWRTLESRGIMRDDRRTWRREFPDHLQHLRGHPAFRAISNARTFDAIEALMGAGRWQAPNDWGGFFLLFPAGRPWEVPTKSWHIDAAYTAPLTPLPGLKVHAMYGDVMPRAGGMTIVGGSHRIVAGWFEEHPPAPGARGATLRHEVMRSVAYLRDLQTDGDRQARIERFHEREEIVDGVPVRVVEMTAAAGDLLLMHPLLLHTRPTNAGTEPRFLLNKDLRAGDAITHQRLESFS